MVCTYEPKEDCGYSGRDYFTREVLPRKLGVRRFCLKGSRVFVHEEDVTILYIRGGKGQAVVSQRHYLVGAGTLMLLYPFCAHQIRAVQGQMLTGVECVANIGSLLFLSAIPDYVRPVTALKQTPCLYQLDEEDQAQAERLWDEMLAENDSVDCFFEKIQYSLLVRLLVSAHRKAEIQAYVNK